ncbi:hypothetical protein WI604_25555 [Bradyrhizobium symbiodeficiens]|uniref:hypothetical protein n=1 Tax=Bradyrhizobium symbiodeficiens TaxID=1404367 RepID=UPI0030D59AB3
MSKRSRCQRQAGQDEGDRFADHPSASFNKGDNGARAQQFRERRSGRAVKHLGIEIRDDVLEGRDRLLNGCDLQKVLVTNRPDAILKRNDEFTPPLLQLDKR